MIILRCYPGILVQSIRDYVSAGISVRASVGVTRNLSSKHIMENFVNMGRQFLQNQSGMNTGAENSQHELGFHPEQVANYAQNHDQQAGHGGMNMGIFSQVANAMHSRHQQGQISNDVDHNQLLSAFKKVQGGQPASSQEAGQASAVDAVKQFFGNNEHKNEGGLSALMGKAMSIAGKNAPNGQKEDAMHHASETVMKMAMKHKMHSMFSGYNEGVSELMDLYT